MPKTTFKNWKKWLSSTGALGMALVTAFPLSVAASDGPEVHPFINVYDNGSPLSEVQAGSASNQIFQSSIVPFDDMMVDSWGVQLSLIDPDGHRPDYTANETQVQAIAQGESVNQYELTAEFEHGFNNGDVIHLAGGGYARIVDTSRFEEEGQIIVHSDNPFLSDVPTPAVAEEVNAYHLIDNVTLMQLYPNLTLSGPLGPESGESMGIFGYRYFFDDDFLMEVGQVKDLAVEVDIDSSMPTGFLLAAEHIFHPLDIVSQTTGQPIPPANIYGDRMGPSLEVIEGDLAPYINIYNNGPESYDIQNRSEDNVLLQASIVPFDHIEVDELEVYLQLRDESGNIPDLEVFTPENTVLNVSPGLEEGYFEITLQDHDHSLDVADMLAFELTEHEMLYARIVSLDGGLVIYTDHENFAELPIPTTVRQVDPYQFIDLTLNRQFPTQMLAHANEGEFILGRSLYRFENAFSMSSNMTFDISIDASVGQEIVSGYELRAILNPSGSEFSSETTGHDIPSGNVYMTNTYGNFMPIVTEEGPVEADSELSTIVKNHPYPTPNYDASALVGAQDDVAAEYHFRAYGDDVTVTSLTIVNDSEGVFDLGEGAPMIKSVQLRYESQAEGVQVSPPVALPNSGVVQIDNLDIFVPAGGEASVEILADLYDHNEEGFILTESNRFYRLGLMGESGGTQGVQAHETVSGDVILQVPTENLRLPGGRMVINGMPHIAMNDLPEDLSEGTQAVYSFTVEAPAHTDIALGRFPLEFELYNNGNQITLSNFTLYVDGMNVNSDVEITANKNVGANLKTTGQLNSNGHNFATISFMNPEVVPAGTTRTYVVEASVAMEDPLVEADMAVRMRYDYNSLDVDNVQIGQLIGNLFENVGQYNQFDDHGIDHEGAIVWSDMAAQHYPGGHVFSTALYGSSNDWITGFSLRDNSIGIHQNFDNYL